MVKTWCGGHTTHGLLFTFCNGEQCCSTDEIQISNDCKTPDVFGSSKTGACKDFDFGSESMVTGNVTYYNLSPNTWDGWRGEWVKLINDSASLTCSINGWIDGDYDGDYDPPYRNFNCTYRKYDT